MKGASPGAICDRTKAQCIIRVLVARCRIQIAAQSLRAYGWQTAASKLLRQGALGIWRGSFLPKPTLCTLFFDTRTAVPSACTTTVLSS